MFNNMDVKTSKMLWTDGYLNFWKCLYKSINNRKELLN